jgi:hypothetical protein
MTQHDSAGIDRVVRNYDFNTLGALFKVTLKNGATKKLDPASGKDFVEMPGTIGLIGAVCGQRLPMRGS